jgi:hypothetical protein
MEYKNKPDKYVFAFRIEKMVQNGLVISEQKYYYV